MKYKMQMKNIIKFLDVMSDVVIWQCDVYKDGPDAGDPEIIFEGVVMDIPWYIMDYYLYNDADSEAIAAHSWLSDNNTKKNGFIISVVEDPQYASEVIA